MFVCVSSDVDEKLLPLFHRACLPDSREDIHRSIDNLESSPCCCLIAVPIELDIPLMGPLPKTTD